MLADHAGYGPAKLRHACGDLGHLVVAVNFGVVGVGPQPINRPRLDLAWREDKVHGAVLV